MPSTNEELDRRIDKVEDCTNKLQDGMNQLLGESNTIKTILKMVVLPLLGIVAALAGVSMAFPNV